MSDGPRARAQDGHTLSGSRSLARRCGSPVRCHPGYEAVQATHGVSRVLAAVFVAEIDDVTRFAGSRQLCSLAKEPRRMTCRHAIAWRPCAVRVLRRDGENHFSRSR
jgi:Transposase IS116/IS110/IS902 family